MRTGVLTVQQTLTSEAANVLKLAVAEAQRRGHAQVTPLHVATTLLSGSSSVLRQACIQSHLHLPQPPHCRNLELCFKVALDRLQTTGSATGAPAAPPTQHGHHHSPALSNALVAALKRAQAHQRRGYPEQQQIPLLAVKVEMEQLIISILDDPSVSRVMREASFCSTEVKNTLEEALASSARRILPSGSSSGNALSSVSSHSPSSLNVERLRLKLGSIEQYPPVASTFQHARRSLESFGAHNHKPLSNVLMGMGVPGSSPVSRNSQDVGRVLDIMAKARKRNPLLFGEQSPHFLADEVIRRLERGECEHPVPKNMRTVSPQFASIALGLHGEEEVDRKLSELGRAVEEHLTGSSSGVLVYLGDLQWLVERPAPPNGSSYCPVQHAVSEIGKLLVRHGNRIWFMAVASSQTYMRCQARHPSLDTLWGLQPLPISSGFGLSLRSNRLGSVDSVVASPAAVRAAPVRWPVLPFKLQNEEEGGSLENCCQECIFKYEQELQELDKSVSNTINEENNGLPFWLKPNKDMDQSNGQHGHEQKLKELQKKWSQTCRGLHGSLRPNKGVGNKVACGTTPMSIPWLSLQPHLATSISKGTQLTETTAHNKDISSVPGVVDTESLSTDIGLSLKPSPKSSLHKSPEQKHERAESEVTVQTELVLGRSVSDRPEVKPRHVETVTTKIAKPVPIPACTPLFGNNNASGLHPVAKELDFKALCKALTESVPWQRAAVESVASTVLSCRSGCEKRKCDTWLLFLGSDASAKRRVAKVLAEQVFGSEKMFFRLRLRAQERITRGPEREADQVVPGRGRTPLDSLADFLRTKPFSVVLIEDIEEADVRLKSALTKAKERGRLADSSGREVSIVNSIIVMTSGVGEELLSRDESFPEMSEGSIASAQAVGMKLLLVTERCVPEEILHREGRLSVVRSAPVTSLGKRKAGKATEVVRGVELDLNVAVEDEQAKAGEALVEEVKTEEENDSVCEKLVLQRASERLSKSFFERMSGAVVFKRYDFGKIAETVLVEIERLKFDGDVEIDVSVFRHLVALVWEGQGGEFRRWTQSVLETSVSRLVEENEEVNEKVVKLVPDSSHSSDLTLHLPKRIKIGDGGT